MDEKQKNIFVIGGIVVAVALIVAIIAVAIKDGTTTRSNKEDALRFKEEYEAINGEVTSSGSKVRTLTISEDNPFVYATAEDILKKIDKKETFIVYFGFPYCPWCRSVLEQAIEVANKQNIKTIYYVNIRNDKNEEILRDKYQLGKKNKPELVSEGAKEYPELLKAFDKVLDDYNLTTEDSEVIAVGEKRIFAPNFIYVKNGTALYLTEGISDKQKDGYQELNKEIIEDEKTEFTKFFGLTK